MTSASTLLSSLTTTGTLSVIAFLSIATPPAFATDYQSFELSSGFAPDPVVGTGAVGGPLDVTEITGAQTTETGECLGYIDTTPDHSIDLESDFQFLSLAVESSRDSSLVVIGPNDEVWCNSGENPSIYGAWEAGTYDVYIGNIAGSGVGDRYELLVSEVMPGGATDDYASFAVAPGFGPDPIIGTGATGGPLLAADLTGVSSTDTGSCEGYVDEIADHYLTLDSDFSYLKLWVNSSTDTSLVVLGPNGDAWCNTGNNPSIYGSWEAGEYEVFIGNVTSVGVGGRYELSIEEDK